MQISADLFMPSFAAMYQSSCNDPKTNLLELGPVCHNRFGQQLHLFINPITGPHAAIRNNWP